MAYNTCADCEYMNLYDRNSFDKAWCGHFGKYYPPSNKACSSFKEKGSSIGSCYLTTIVCEILNFEDNCYALEKLRYFRETYLKNNSQGKMILKEYDEIGPNLSLKLHNISENRRIASNIFDVYILDILNDINNNCYDDAISKYKNMVYYIETL